MSEQIPENLIGKKIVVTGGSRGIGAAIVRLLADKGALVAFTYSSQEDAAQKVIESIRRKYPEQSGNDGHFYVRMDLANEESINTATEQILSRWKSVDGLVNNAGITKDQLLLRMKSQDFDIVMNTNLRGTFLVTKNFSKIMLKAKKGSIVNITSVIGQTGNPGQSSYAASKAGTVAFSKSIAQELGSRDIRVNCVAPGFITTDMTEQLDENVKNKILEKIPLGCLGEASDVAHAVRFLLSDESKYITGHTINVNGGMYME